MRRSELRVQIDTQPLEGFLLRRRAVVDVNWRELVRLYVPLCTNCKYVHTSLSTVFGFSCCLKPPLPFSVAFPPPSVDTHTLRFNHQVYLIPHLSVLLVASMTSPS